jgi:glucosamine--fructose-6-phosphate aminotransferase (isomerizing)
MLKEIFEQPKAVADTLIGRLSDNNQILLDELHMSKQEIQSLKKITVIACGTAYHAGLVAKYAIEKWAKIPVDVEIASEFRYRDPIIDSATLVIAISQSGETADTLAALELAKSKGATILGVCNVVGSSISRVTDAGCYTHAGPEIGVASTKAFTAQVTVLTLMALSLAHKKGTISESAFHALLTELEDIPAKVKEVLKTNSIIEKIAAEYADAANALYLGRGSSFPVALEGALKLKEISYIHAEGYPAAEMKHGPIALIDENMPVFVIATKGNSYEKVVSNIQEVKARKGKIIAIVTEGDVNVKEMADHVIEIPETHEYLVPLLATIPLQLLSYHIALMRGCNVDQPRNLAKSVTVE